MAKITFVQPDGSSRTVDAASGTTVKDAAINHLIPGIVAECGGACACGTCHVHVDAAWMKIVGEPAQAEKEMLEFSDDVKDVSRLSCQIRVMDGTDGLIVHVPES